MRIIRAILLVAVLAGALHFTMMGISAMRVAAGDAHHAMGHEGLPECPMGFVCPAGTFDLTSTVPAMLSIGLTIVLAAYAATVARAIAPRLAHGPPLDASPAAQVRRLLTVLKRE